MLRPRMLGGFPGGKLGDSLCAGGLQESALQSVLVEEGRK